MIARSNWRADLDDLYNVYVSVPKDPNAVVLCECEDGIQRKDDGL